MKKNYLVVLLALIANFATAQIEQTSYRGAFAPAPTAMWTDSWTNYDPQNTVYPSATVTVGTDITTNTTWTTGTTYALSGLIYVRNNAVLTIQPGVVIKGAGAGAALIITKGAKLNAIGTAASPIVFTSNQPAGSRNKGDWGGVILLGKGAFNLNNGVNNIEGITASVYTEYGGGLTPDNNDNSGTLKYVRIEYGGYVYAPNNEINGLTLGAVGKGTTIDYVQVSFSNDDAFEWFGGTVDCKHLVSYRNLDDDFDTDNGYSGTVQYALAVRDPQISDAPAVSTSEGFESDNNAGGTAVSPCTSAIFTNCTLIGPSYRVTLPSGGTLATGFKRGARIRRNSQLKIFNSLFMDFQEGVHVDGIDCENNALAGTLKFKNNILAGIVTTSKVLQVTSPGTITAGNNASFNMTNWYTAGGNSTVASNSGLLTSPYNTSDATTYTGLDYRPASGSIVETGADFTDSSFTGKLVAAPAVVADIEYTSFRGAFAPAPTAMWTDNWTNYDPQNAVYASTGITVSGDITTNTTWTTGNTYLLQGLTYVKNNATLTIQPGVTIRGAGAGASLIVTKGAKLNAVGTATSPIVFTSNNPVGSRNKGDWGGVILLGKGSFNLNNGVNNIEGITATTDTEYGGGLAPDDNDNSGTLKYVRIEFGGYVYAPNNEINGLTFGAVGRGTTIDYVQVSYSNDDAFEWFGGTVNCKHLVSYRNLDDDFDTDNGFSGKVQYALAVRDPQISDAPAVSTSEGFESDNNAGGTAVSPYTSAIFTNCTLIGPSYRVTLPNGGSLATGFKRGARIRRNSKLSIYNSIFMDFQEGLHVDGVDCENNALAGTLRFKNNILAGIVTTSKVLQVTSPGTITAGNNPAFNMTTWYAANNNTTATTNAGILTLPYNTANATVYTGLDYRPATASIALSGSNFAGLVALVPPTVTSPLNLCKGGISTLSATLAGGVSLKWYTVATGGTATTTAPILVTSKAPSTTSYWVSQVYSDGSESTRAQITVNVNAIPATPAALTGTAKLSAIIGTTTTTTTTYLVADVVGAVSYNWVTPLGVNIISGQGTNTLTVNFNNVPAGAGLIGNLSVQAVNASGCPSIAKVLVLTKELPKATKFIMTVGPASTTSTVNGIITTVFAKPVKTFGEFMGQSNVLTLTATPSPMATSYAWELPAGVTKLSGGNSNVITIDFSGVTAANTYSYTDVTGVFTRILRIGVKAVNGVGSSVTNNSLLLDPATTSTAALLTLKAVAPKAPRATMYDMAISSTTVVKDISTYIGTAKPLTLVAAPMPCTYGYQWELPTGVNQLSSNVNSSTITVNFSGVPAGTTSLYIGVKSQNGAGLSSVNNSLMVPATSSTASLLLLKAAAPAASKVVRLGAVGPVCRSVNYTITAAKLATSYTITAPAGSIVTSANHSSNSSNVLSTADLDFTVHFPSNVDALSLADKVVSVTAVNGVGSSLSTNLTFTTALGIAKIAGLNLKTFLRSTTSQFSIVAVTGATGYQWSASNGAVISGNGTTNVTVDFSAVPTGVTSVTLNVNPSNDCVTAVRTSLVLTNISGTAKMITTASVDSNTVSAIYPNPSSELFNIDLTTAMSGVMTMSIYSSNGSLVRTRNLQLNEGNNTISEDISSLNSGIYFVRLINSASNETIVRKLVKE